MSDIKKLQECISQFTEERDWDQFHNGKDLAIALSLEASELHLNIANKTTVQYVN